MSDNLPAPQQVQYVPVPVPVAPATRPASSGVIVTAWIVTFLTVFYMLPWAIAASRGKPNQAAIGLVNFLVGWTFIGWIIALVMACL
jgi:hypothetical protein